MDNKEKKVYDLLFKKNVIKEVMMGETVISAAEKYGISEGTLRTWIQKYNDEMKQEIIGEMNVLKDENKALKTLLGERDLEIFMLKQRLKEA